MVRTADRSQTSTLEPVTLRESPGHEVPQGRAPGLLRHPGLFTGRCCAGWGVAGVWWLRRVRSNRRHPPQAQLPLPHVIHRGGEPWTLHHRRNCGDWRGRIPRCDRVPGAPFHGRPRRADLGSGLRSCGRGAAYTADLCESFSPEVWITVKRTQGVEGTKEHYSVFKRLMIGAHKL